MAAGVEVTGFERLEWFDSWRVWHVEPLFLSKPPCIWYIFGAFEYLGAHGKTSYAPLFVFGKKCILFNFNAFIPEHTSTIHVF